MTAKRLWITILAVFSALLIATGAFLYFTVDVYSLAHGNSLWIGPKGKWESYSQGGSICQFYSASAESDYSEYGLMSRGTVRKMGAFAAKVLKGDAEATYQLGRAIHRGIEEPKNDALAVAFMREAAMKSHVKALIYLGDFVRDGRGTKKDPQKAFDLYALASRLGDPVAFQRWADLIIRTKAFREHIPDALVVLRGAADRGFGLANYQLGKLYFDGDKVPQSMFLAALYFRRAGYHPMGIYLLGYMFEKGIGFAPNLETAVSYYCSSHSAMGDRALARIVTSYGDNLQAEYWERGAESYDTPWAFRGTVEEEQTDEFWRKQEEAPLMWRQMVLEVPWKQDESFAPASLPLWTDGQATLPPYTVEYTVP